MAKCANKERRDFQHLIIGFLLPLFRSVDMPEISPYQAWCNLNDCAHGHCPQGCEHPQPQLAIDGRMICGKHFYDDNEIVEIIPCNPATCVDEVG
jgi:hypothetical protein